MRTWFQTLTLHVLEAVYSSGSYDSVIII